MVDDTRSGRIEMAESIVSHNLPERFTADCESRGVYNLSAHFFHEEGPDKTRCVNENEIKFSGLMALMGIFMRGAFPRQTTEHMQRFKAFAGSA